MPSLYEGSVAILLSVPLFAFSIGFRSFKISRIIPWNFENTVFLRRCILGRRLRKHTEIWNLARKLKISKVISSNPPFKEWHVRLSKLCSDYCNGWEILVYLAEKVCVLGNWNVQCPNLMNLSRGLNLPKTGFNRAPD